MAEFGKGIKAGILAGVIEGVILIAVIAAMAETLLPGFWATMGALGSTGLAMTVFAIVGIIGGIFSGLIFGAIYAAAYGSLPGSSIVKGMILSIVMWLVFSVALNYGTIAQYPTYAAISLITSLLWGALVGIFWDKFGSKA